MSAVQTPLGRGAEGGLLSYYVYGSQQRGRPVGSSCRSFKYFYPYDVADIYGYVEGVVTCLRVTNIDTVE